jgi:Fur family ferric uptake transcriptional regulator
MLLKTILVTIGWMSDWIVHARRELARAGHRAGGARGEVLELLGRQHCCLSAQEIHDRLRDEGRAVGLASVYRALDALADPELEKLIHGLGERLGYDVGAHDIVLRGSCPDCAAH